MKQLNGIIASSLVELVNKSFQSDIIPDIFKIAKAISIFKSESRVLRNTHRPISLLSNISKLIETLMHKLLYSFLEQQNCFYNGQFVITFFTKNLLFSLKIG